MVASHNTQVPDLITSLIFCSEATKCIFEVETWYIAFQYWNIHPTKNWIFLDK